MGKILLIIFLVSAVHSANVLVLSGLRGSHQYLSTNVADKLVDFGHNVTVLSGFSDPRKDMSEKRFHFKAYLDKVDKGGKTYFDEWDKQIEYLTTLPSEEMTADFVIQMKEQIQTYDTLAMEYFLSAEFDQILKNGKFDLIVVEQTDHIPSAPKLVDVDVPILGLLAIPTMVTPRKWGRFPTLCNSEPNTINTIKDESHPPYLIDRIKTLIRNIRVGVHIYPILLKLYGAEMERTQRSFDDYYFSFFDIVFVNDHSAFSFPHIAPPNTFYLAPFDLNNRASSPLPKVYLEFFKNCPFDKVINFSFGTYFRNITRSPLAEVVVKALAGFEVCVVMKTEVDVIGQFGLSSTQFLQQKWVPQLDLLASGRIHYFFSHCGNNGRIESIFYNVPLLCLPLFADQFLNARLVQNKNFGVMLTREEVDERTLARAHDEMLGRREEFSKNMKQAAEIASSDPGAGVSALRFYSDLLIKYGNAEFLNNRLIEKQSDYEIHNFDIIVVLGLMFIAIIMFIVVVVVKFCFYCCNTFANCKLKGE